jgi:hypothetical protein
MAYTPRPTKEPGRHPIKVIIKATTPPKDFAANSDPPGIEANPAPDGKALYIRISKELLASAHQ